MLKLASHYKNIVNIVTYKSYKYTTFTNILDKKSFTTASTSSTSTYSDTSATSDTSTSDTSTPSSFSLYSSDCPPTPPYLELSASEYNEPIQYDLPTSSSTTPLKNAPFLPGKMAIIYTCGVCNIRSKKNFSKHAYVKGVVLIKCDTCKNLHIIADNIGWFDHGKNIEEIMKNLGKRITKLDANQTMQLKTLEPELQKFINEASEKENISTDKEEILKIEESKKI